MKPLEVGDYISNLKERVESHEVGKFPAATTQHILFSARNLKERVESHEVGKIGRELERIGISKRELKAFRSRIAENNTFMTNLKERVESRNRSAEKRRNYWLRISKRELKDSTRSRSWRRSDANLKERVESNIPYRTYLEWKKRISKRELKVNHGRIIADVDCLNLKERVESPFSSGMPASSRRISKRELKVKALLPDTSMYSTRNLKERVERFFR